MATSSRTIQAECFSLLLRLLLLGYLIFARFSVLHCIYLLLRLYLGAGFIAAATTKLFEIKL